MKTFFKKPEYRSLKAGLLLLFGFAFFLRTYKWLNYSLWYDEVIWIMSGESFCRDFLVYSAKPPLFTILVFFWQNISGQEYFLRLPSLFFGVLNVFQIYLLGEVLFDKKVGLGAALLLAFSPLHIYYSQELSPYTLVLSLVLAGNFFLLKWFQTNKSSYQYGYIFLTVAAIYTHYICFFLILIHNIFIFLLYDKPAARLLKKWLISQLLVIVCVIPLGSLLWDSIQIMRSSPGTVYNWMPQGDIFYFFCTFLTFIFGYHTQLISRIVFVLLQIFLLFLLVKLFLKHRLRIVFLVCWLVLPPLLSLILGNFFAIPLYTHRNFFLSLPAYLILLAFFLNQVAFKYRLTIVVIVFVLIGNSLVNYYQNEFYTPERPYRPGIFSKKDHLKAALYISDKFLVEDTVMHLSESNNSVFYYYFKKFSNDKLKVFMEKCSENEKYLLREKEQLNERLKGYTRLWLVFSAWDYPYEPIPALPSYIKSTLNKKFKVLESKKFEGIMLYLYDLQEK